MATRNENAEEEEEEKRKKLLDMETNQVMQQQQQQHKLIQNIYENRSLQNQQKQTKTPDQFRIFQRCNFPTKSSKKLKQKKKQ